MYIYHTYIYIYIYNIYNNIIYMYIFISMVTTQCVLNNRHTCALPVTYINEIIIMKMIVHHAVSSLIYNESSYIGLEVWSSSQVFFLHWPQVELMH